MAREGARLTAQALQQMGPARRLTTLVATLRELEASLTDAAISMFSALVGRANLNARKRLEETIAIAGEQGRARLTRIAAVLEAPTKAACRGAEPGHRSNHPVQLSVSRSSCGFRKIGAGIGNEEALRQLSPLGWDHINLTGDYVWSDPAAFDADGFLPLKISER